MEVTKENLEIVRKFMVDLGNLMDKRLREMTNRGYKTRGTYTGEVIDIFCGDYIRSYTLDEYNETYRLTSEFLIDLLDEGTFKEFLEVEKEKKLKEETQIRERELAELKRLQEKYKGEV